MSRLARESHASSFQLAAILNARGAMEIVAAHYALNAGLIDSTQYVALLLLAILSSLMAFPLIPRARQEPSP